MDEMVNNGEKVLVDRKKVDMFMMSNQKYFPTEKLVFLKEKLYTLDESRFSMASVIELKDPTTMLLLSLFLGAWGVDRFMLKDTSIGILKLLTGGLCGILTIVDWFSIQKKTKEMNFQNFMSLL